MIVPAYNEAENIKDCLTAILKSTSLPSETLEVWLVDDQSTDETWAIAQSLQHRLNDPRLNLLAGQPRPIGQPWVGKNWACTQAADRSNGDFLLFIDADTRLQPGAIEAAIQTAEHEQAALLTILLPVICDCFAEWLVQPLMFAVIALSCNFDAVNDPTSETAFAAGPFMLFRRTAYEQLGGHRAVADQVVEDVELARLVKAKRLPLKFVSGINVAVVRMYRSWAALWEGWTKNIYLGSRRNLRGMLSFIGMVLLICTVPWIGLFISLGEMFLSGFSWMNAIALGLSLILIATQYAGRRIAEPLSQIPTRYWWLTGLGGIVVAAIVIGSIIKTETGWGWTWRGRPLKSSPKISPNECENQQAHP